MEKINPEGRGNAHLKPPPSRSGTLNQPPSRISMAQTFTVTGGARIGWINATYPFAQLTATPNELSLSISLLGTYIFAPEQVSAIEKYVVIPVLGWGIRIHHSSTECPKHVVFWSLSNPKTVLDGICNSGFQPSAPNKELTKGHGIAMRPLAIVVAVVIWNALFLLSAFRPSDAFQNVTPIILAPLLFAFALSLGALMSQKLQRIILKPGRSVGEIRPFLRLLAFISGFLLVVLYILLTFGVFPSHAQP